MKTGFTERKRCDFRDSPVALLLRIYIFNRFESFCFHGNETEAVEIGYPFFWDAYLSSR